MGSQSWSELGAEWSCRPAVFSQWVFLGWVGSLLGGMGRFLSVPPRQNRLGPPLEVHPMTQGVVEIRIYSELRIRGS